MRQLCHTCSSTRAVWPSQESMRTFGSLSRVYGWFSLHTHARHNHVRKLCTCLASCAAHSHIESSIATVFNLLTPCFLKHIKHATDSRSRHHALLAKYFGKLSQHSQMQLKGAETCLQLQNSKALSESRQGTKALRHACNCNTPKRSQNHGKATKPDMARANSQEARQGEGAALEASAKGYREWMCASPAGCPYACAGTFACKIDQVDTSPGSSGAPSAQHGSEWRTR